MTYLKIDKTSLINLEYSLRREIIRTNRSGAYSCSTIIDCNTRKYHGLLICPLPELDDHRHIILSSLHETIIQHNVAFNLGMHKYAGDHYDPKGHKYVKDFDSSPIPTLEYQVGGVILSKEKVLVENENQILIKYTLVEAKSKTKLRLRPFLGFRNIHNLSKANLFVNPKYDLIDNGISSSPYNEYPSLQMQLNKKNEFIPAPDWYYDIEYSQDQKRGYEYKEDLFTPGFFEFDIKKGESIVFSASLGESSSKKLKRKFSDEVKKRIPRVNFNTCLANTVQQFFIHENKNLDVIAGYPWHPIRNRDALIALPGLTLPFYDEKKYLQVLKTIERKFEYHTINEIQNNAESGYPTDIPLWFIWSVQQYGILYDKKKLWTNFGHIIETIINGYFNEKTLFKVESNGLIYCYENSTPNSWMNASVNYASIIKRSGNLIEVNALWFNALCFAKELSQNFANKKLNKLIPETINKLENSIISKFWNCNGNYLHDFVNIEASNQIRPNQILAASLPYSVLNKKQIKCIIEKIQTDLITPYGLRTLSPNDSEYKPVYKGNHENREKAAFNGSAWPWLLTPFYEAWLKIDPKAAIRNGEKHLSNFEDELQQDGICSISELYHGNPPHKANGAISFAVNTAELIRLRNLIDNAYKIY